VATISKYQTASGATLYRVRYRTPERGQTDKRGFQTKRDAEAFANSVEVSKLKGEYVSPSDGRISVGQLGPAWLARQRGHLKPSGYRVYETAWRIHVAPRWGRVALGDIRTSAVQQWVVDLDRGPSVINRAHHVLASILSDAVTDKMLSHNPATGVKLPRNVRKPHAYLTHQQVTALAAASGEHEALVLMLAYTGLRWGEVVGLRVRDLNLLRKRVTVTENAVEAGGEIHVGTPKTHKQRPVPVPAFLLT
jgi:integrase